MTELEQGSEKFSAFKTESWVQRKGFSHWAVAMLWLVIVLISFQVVATLVLVGMLGLTGNMDEMMDLATLMAERIDLVFIGNSIGQILFIGLATFIVVKSHTIRESSFSFLRIRWYNNTLLYILLGGLLMLAVQPIVVYLGYLNSLLPLPDAFSDLQLSQAEMIQNFLSTEGILLFGLLNVAVVPAICEEVLFRGYVMRAFEKSWGIIAAIIVSGLIFGMFHLQLGNVLPLATLGIILALMTWLSGSIWPAVVAHFLNNGSAVVLGVNFPDMMFVDVTAETLPPVWLLLISIAATSGIIYMMFKQNRHS